MTFNVKLPSGFRSLETGERTQYEGIATGDLHSEYFLSALPLRASKILSIGISLLLVLFMTLTAFAAEASDTPSAITPSEQAYSAYQKGDFETARTLWRQLATRGDAAAQYNLGLIYSEGRGVPRNPQAAIKWWRLAAKNGYVQAQHNLALAYLGGETARPGIAEEPRLDAALVWLRKAAKHGLASSRYILGSILLDRASGTEDNAEAIGFLVAAADQGHAEAQFRLGKCFFEGQGVDVDRREGLALFLKAAGSGYAPAQDRLAAMYQTGEFVPMDTIEALAWANLASASGLVTAIERRKALLDHMSASEIGVAEIRSSELSTQ